jgi:hypothetical protein
VLSDGDIDPAIAVELEVGRVDLTESSASIVRFCFARLEMEDARTGDAMTGGARTATGVPSTTSSWPLTMLRMRVAPGALANALEA